jgi:hypothetical protein
MNPSAGVSFSRGNHYHIQRKYLYHGDLHEQVQRHKKRNQEETQAQPERKKAIKKIEARRLSMLSPTTNPFPGRGLLFSPPRISQAQPGNWNRNQLS